MAEPQLQNVALLRMDRPDHACPWGLKALRRLQEQQIPFEDHRLTTDAEVQAFKAQHQVATTPQIFSNGKGIGGNSDLAALLVNIATGGDVMSFMGFALALLAMLSATCSASTCRSMPASTQAWSCWWPCCSASPA
jgi:glutaredoxin